jgi:hemerythrin
MSTFEWSDRFALGIAEIDRQHKHWFELTNGFLDLVRSGLADKDAVQRALARAVAHAQAHFKAEESLMRRVGFPRAEFDWHRMTHNAFVERVNALAKRCREGHPKAVTEMSTFMSGWLVRHIIAADVRYIGFHLSKYRRLPGDVRRPSAVYRVRKRIALRHGLL